MLVGPSFLDFTCIYSISVLLLENTCCKTRLLLRERQGDLELKSRPISESYHPLVTISTIVCA